MASFCDWKLVFPRSIFAFLGQIELTENLLSRFTVGSHCLTVLHCTGKQQLVTLATGIFTRLPLVAQTC